MKGRQGPESEDNTRGGIKYAGIVGGTPMSGQGKDRNIKKRTASLAALAAAVLLFVVLAFTGISAPQNPMEEDEADASRMYLISSSLLVDSQRLAQIQNANISTGVSENSAGAESQDQSQTQEQTQEAEQHQEQEQQQEQQEQEQKQEQEQQQEAEARQEEDIQQDEAQNETDRLSSSVGSMSAVDTSQATAGQGSESRLSADAQTAVQNELASTSNLLSLIKKNQTSDTLSDGTAQSGLTGTGGSDGGGATSGTTTDIDPSDIVKTGSSDSTTLSAEQSENLFVTSLKDDSVNYQNYPFTVTLTDEGRKLSLVSMNVTLNGSTRGCFESDSLTLNEGENTVSVTVRFRDSSNNEINAQSATYTIRYAPVGTIVLNVFDADTGEQLQSDGTYTVYLPETNIRVEAEKSTSDGFVDVSYMVRFDNTRVGGQDNVFALSGYTAGDHELRVTAGEQGVEQVTFTSTIKYRLDSFRLDFKSEQFTETVSDNTTISDRKFGGLSRKTITSSDSAFSFMVTCSQDTGVEKVSSIRVTNSTGTIDVLNQAGANGYITINLDARQDTYIAVYCINSSGQEQSFTWQITYNRVIDGEENNKKKPIIHVSNLSNGDEVHDGIYSMTVKAWDYNGNELIPVGDDKSKGNFSVTLNGQEITFDSIQYTTGYYEYWLNLTEGQNTVVVTAWDYEQYTTLQEITFNFSPSGGNINVTFKFNADTVGLGTMIEYEYNGTVTNLSELIELIFNAHGYTTVHDGTAGSSDYYLTRVEREGIAEGYSISREERVLLEEEGIELNDTLEDTGSLGEKDFTTASGWMVTVNHEYIGHSMGMHSLKDGDVINILYTLDLGNDVGIDRTN